jgi:ADP-ribose pyrophosphatase YjhB (NUDIX family)
MSEDPDLPKASYELQVLRQARLSRNETAAKMVEHLVYVTANTGLRTPEIEEAQQAAWVAISELASALDKEEFAPPDLWKAALRATESWRETAGLASQ